MRGGGGKMKVTNMPSHLDEKALQAGLTRALKPFKPLGLVKVT